MGSDAITVPYRISIDPQIIKWLIRFVLCIILYTWCSFTFLETKCRLKIYQKKIYINTCAFIYLQARGLKKHLKRLNAPKHWMLDKLGGAFVSELSFEYFPSNSRWFELLQLIKFWSFALQAPKPSSGPHKSRECLPLVIIMRNRLKYALTYREVISILMQRQVMVDGKVRTDKTYPAGFMGKCSISTFFCFWYLF